MRFYKVQNMKTLVQSFKSGKLEKMDIPVPQLMADGILVKTHTSLISSGTDRAIIELAQKNLIDKARSRPDLIRKVINKIKTDGIMSTLNVIQNKLDEPLPLGYSLVGEIIAVGNKLPHLSIGTRVACAGQGYASHAEVVAIPKHLFVPVPDAVSDEQAAYVTLGAIAMHGVRQANQQLGSTVLIVGLGLVGLITVQLCVAAGLRVIGMDFDERKLALAKKCGAIDAVPANMATLAENVSFYTQGSGIDAVLLTAGSADNGDIFEWVAHVCRDRAKIVVVGDVKMDISRRTYFQKELEILQSRSYGPGRYDPEYENQGHDYPIGYVRWTENRNMQSFLQLIADNKIDLSLLTTHQFPFEQVQKAYDLILNPAHELTIGVLLNYEKEITSANAPIKVAKHIASGKINVGVIGTGQFAKTWLIPALANTQQFALIGVASQKGISAGHLKNRFAAQFATCDAQQILDNATINAVVIATRHDTHANLVIEALNRDKHVFVEKPLCLKREELTAILQAAEKSKGILMVGYNRRFSPLCQTIQEHFQTRKEPLSILYRINAGRIPLNSESAWVHTEKGGGRLIGEVCHFIDFCQAIIGMDPVEISCFNINPHNQHLVANDCVTLTIRYADGSLATIHYWSNGDSSLSKEYMEIFGAGKIAILDNFKKLTLIIQGKRRKIRCFKQQKGYNEEALAFAKACKQGKSPIDMNILAGTSLMTFDALDLITQKT